MEDYKKFIQLEGGLKLDLVDLKEKYDLLFDKSDKVHNFFEWLEKEIL